MEGSRNTLLPVGKDGVDENFYENIDKTRVDRQLLDDDQEKKFGWNHLRNVYTLPSEKYSLAQNRNSSLLPLEVTGLCYLRLLLKIRSSLWMLKVNYG